MADDMDRDIAELEAQLARLRELSARRGLEVGGEIRSLEATLDDLRSEAYRNLSPVDRVQLARHPKRPYTLDYVERTFTDFMELHGDRAFRDDEAIVGGWARLEGRTVMLVGQQKGRDMKENLRRNFGMPHPEGYRKALRLFQLAEKFGHPVITLVDTPGAYPGIGAEERGQAEAIARNLRDMARLRVPILTTVIGEGGSGGALALGVCDRLFMFENAIYSVISPEGCAAILWKTPAAKDKAAEALRLTAADLTALGVADEVLEEPAGGAQHDPEAAARTLGAALHRTLEELCALDADALRRRRWARYEALGAYRTVEA
jgi:acetyl-CoA carboxylase carboxyl transferase subunit alpha